MLTDAQLWQVMADRFTMEIFGKPAFSDRTPWVLGRLEALEFAFLSASTFFIMKQPRKEETVLQDALPVDWPV